MSDPASTIAETTVQPSSTLKCNRCSHQFEIEERFFRCYPCRRGDFSVCQNCVQGKAFSAEGHHPQPCFLDFRDSRTTFLPAPDISTFTALISNARTDCSLSFPIKTQKFLSRSSIDGISTERLESSNTYHQNDDEFSTTTLKHEITNNYDLYEKLDAKSKDIRLLMLVQGSPEDFITVILGRFSFPWTQTSFSALSYRWGDLDETRSVAVVHMANRLGDGGKPEYKQQGLAVTANLEIALRALRRADKPIWLWVDAICINQGDPQERADQVNIMAEIYAHASNTIVWLGTNAEEAESLLRVHAFLKCIKQMHKQNPTVDQLPFMLGLVNNARISINGEQIDHIDVVKGMTKLFQNQWFTRVWVLQEIAHTTSMAYILVNGAGPLLQWNELRIAQNYLVAAFTSLKVGVGGLPSPWLEVEDFRLDRTSGSSKLLPILELFAEVCHRFDATDQRDKLFALLSIAKETRDSAKLSPLIQPNYTKSTAQVFVDFTRWCIYHHRTLQVLGFVTYSDRKSFPANEEHRIPTWALSPKQRFPRHQHVLSQFEEFRAAADSELDLSLLNDHIRYDSLRLRGYRLLTIVNAEKRFFQIHWDTANELYMQDVGSDRFYFGGIHWLWRGACGPGTKLGRFCEPVPGRNVCSGKYSFDEFLLMVTCGGLKRHGNCDHSKGIHRTGWLKPADMYEMFATYWINHGANWADPEMELFCPHVRDILKPLAGRGDPDAFALLLIGSATRKTLIAADGWAGLGPPGTQKGDIIVALCGGNVPFVLRPRQAEDVGEQDWEFIGECFLNEYMDGKHVQNKIDRQEPSEVFTLR